MDDANKILDVTYGGFSCRLEGFEDSVETMKTVVSYFHDLAGHDRFMDMDPQAPDMETLARLTEEQSGVAVEVEGEGQNVSLRAAVGAAAAVAATDELADDLEALADEDWDDAGEDAQMDDAADADDGEGIAEADLEDSVADKLNRIRAVVDQGPTEDTSDAYAEDLPEADDVDVDAPVAANPLSQRLSELAQRASEPRFADDAPTQDDVNPETANDDAAHEDEINDRNTIDDTTEDETDEFEFVAEEETPDDNPDADTDADDAAAQEDADDVAAEADEDLVAQDDSDDEDLAQDTDDAEMDDVAEEDKDEKVLMLSEDDVDAEATAKADAMRIADVSRPLVLTSRQSDEDEDLAADEDFDLEAEVAKVEAELAERPGNEVARHGLPRSVDDSMSRILTQTNQHLDQPESRRHRDAFAQLKAAVAATEAARQLGEPDAASKDPNEAFKDDLGAHDAGETSDGIEAPKSTPLKLVKTRFIEVEPAAEDESGFMAEDTPDAPLADAAKAAETEAAPQQEPAPAAEVKPLDAASQRLRQIAAGKEASTLMAAGGFKEFAAEKGADDLVDKIEAAAAYLYYVEGNDDFSRPQVMKTVQTASDQEISREDGLRAFGRLLRIAKIVKLSNGRFRISENSEYRPDNAQAAQG